MANGQQKARENIDKFDIWVATQSDDDFRQIAFRGKLKRGEIATAAGFGKSVLIQNPEVAARLKILENALRVRGVLPPMTEAGKVAEGQPKEYDQSVRRRQLDANKVGRLEQENIELKAKVRELEARLERFGELSDTLADMGFMPR
jgi:hypothetical protein